MVFASRGQSNLVGESLFQNEFVDNWKFNWLTRSSRNGLYRSLIIRTLLSPGS
jgi:hypothetical protein